MGYGMMEEVLLDKGKILNPNFTNYIIPTSMDIPEIASVCSGNGRVYGAVRHERDRRSWDERALAGDSGRHRGCDGMPSAEVPHDCGRYSPCKERRASGAGIMNESDGTAGI